MQADDGWLSHEKHRSHCVQLYVTLSVSIAGGLTILPYICVYISHLSRYSLYTWTARCITDLPS